MRLLAELEGRIGTETSFFRAQLFREDLARLRQLLELARTTEDTNAYVAAGRRLGWTQGDARTSELRPLLDPLLEAVRDYARGHERERADDRALEAWTALTRERVLKLVGCLSTPVPPPEPE